MNEYTHLSGAIQLCEILKKWSQQRIRWKKNKFGNIYTSKVYVLNKSIKVKTSLEKFVHLVLYYKLYTSQKNRSLSFEVDSNINFIYLTK